MLFSVVISDAIFSARSLFDDLNGSKHIGTSHWNLKNTLGKTVQHIFKSVAAWPLKLNAKNCALVLVSKSKDFSA